MTVTPTAAIELVHGLVLAIDMAPGVAIFAVDRDGLVRLWNGHSAQLYGVAEEDALGQPLTSLLGRPAAEQEFAAQVAALWDGAAPAPARDWEVSLRDGSHKWVCSTAFGMLHEGRTHQVFYMEIDISARKKTERALYLASKVFECCHDAIVITDTDYRIVAANHAYTHLSGVPVEQILGQPAPFLNGDERFPGEVRDGVERTGFWHGEMVLQHRSGTDIPVAVAVTAVRDPGGGVSHYVGIMADISERKRIEEETRHLAEHDFLTGLPNRLLFQDRLQVALANARRQQRKLAILYLDLDKFKAINDGHGHALGDAVLKKVAATLSGCVRSVDTVIRQGGDEFVLLLADIGGADQAAHVASAVLHAVRAIEQVDGMPVKMGASIGISLFPDDGGDQDTLCRHADAAMYHAKRAGRNGFSFYSAQLNANVVEHIAMENSMREALARGEFVLEYQPVIDLSNGRICGVEALLRWRHPQRGLLMPGQFLPLAEECGLAVPIGHWVLKHACAQAAEWRASGFPVVLSVNLSAAQFLDAGMADAVQAALAHANLDAQWLELEITEAILARGRDAAEGILARLSALGVRVTLDDFGSGYSKLDDLRRYPLSRLKIDPAFVRELPEGGDIIPAMIMLARCLKLKVTAEGVETEAQMRFLQQHGCDAYQGRFAASSFTPPPA